MNVKVKKWKEVDYLFPQKTAWSLHVDGISNFFRYYKENTDQESDYCIYCSIEGRKTERGRTEQDVIVSAKISSKENTLSFDIYGPKRLVIERKNEIDYIKSVISAIVLEVKHEE